MNADVDTIRDSLCWHSPGVPRDAGNAALAALDRLAAAEARAEALTPTSWMDLHAEAVERAEAAEAQRDDALTVERSLRAMLESVGSQRDTLAEAANRAHEGDEGWSAENGWGIHGFDPDSADRCALCAALAAVTPTEATP